MKNVKLFKLIRNIIIVLIALGLALFILKVAPNYKYEEITDKTNLVINNNNITAHLKNDVIMSDGVAYLSRADVYNFFDPYIYYNEDEQRIITSYGTKVASLVIDKTSITINGKEYTLSSPAITKNNTVYLPFSLMETVYNAEIEYIENTDTITVETLTREKITATANKNLSLKSKSKTLSKTIDKIKKSDTLVIISKLENGWAKVRTPNGKIGYVQQNKLSNETVVREAIEEKPLIEGKVSLVWDDYYNGVAPDRSGTTIDGVNVVSPRFFELERLGKGNVIDNAGESGKKYVQWAKSNGYQVWAFVANDSMIQTTSEIMNSYELRSKLIENILTLAQKYELDGINIDFEYMYDEDIDLFTQFLVELYPRLQELNMVLSVDVTAPDGGENWSTCFNRHDIADNCDFIVFMAYDQYGEASTTAGSTAAYDWVKVNLNKFLTTEEIDAEKIILGIPFYTRLWEENSSGKIESKDVVSMKNISRVLPSGVQKTWLDDKKQYYVEYTRGSSTYKMWIEDETSIREKLSLVTENNLGGAAYWAKGREDESIWQVIDEILF